MGIFEKVERAFQDLFNPVQLYAKIRRWYPKVDKCKLKGVCTQYEVNFYSKFMDMTKNVRRRLRLF